MEHQQGRRRRHHRSPAALPGSMRRVGEWGSKGRIHDVGSVRVDRVVQLHGSGFRLHLPLVVWRESQRRRTDPKSGRVESMKGGHSSRSSGLEKSTSRARLIGPVPRPFSPFSFSTMPNVYPARSQLRRNRDNLNNHENKNHI